MPKNNPLKPRIVFEDPDLLVLNKPTGLLVHAAASAKDEPSLVDFLLAQYPMIKKVGEDPRRPGIVHRLDRDTSGLMLAAKTAAAFSGLKRAFKLRQIKKTYLALVFGVVADKQKIIDMPIARSPKGFFVARHAADVGKIKPTLQKKYRWATTFVRELERFAGYTLLAAEPRTGRTHQIRVHLKAWGYPIVGDQLYSGLKQRHLAKKEFGLGRQFLHAAELSFKHPLSGRPLRFESELPADLRHVLDQLHAQK